jgi:poly-gamma-glutamate synthesis protein (capsule biosynthesis protein)
MGENRLAFMGCSQAGPEAVFATELSPGSNPCDDEWLEDTISSSIMDDMIPIVTFQHLEVEDYVPHSSQRVDFNQASLLGAVIVSGSQSHFAQTMTFLGEHFIHYGLGNLFFDQMYGENPKAFIDRHFFYNGRYISTELITLMLEDASKPRLMTLGERQEFLHTIFEKCDWTNTFNE